jgi:hypothetical protein
MRIKKHKNKNEYLLSESGIWVRNFTKKNAIQEDINQLTTTDFNTLLDNELKNQNDKYPYFDFDNKINRKIVIVSDGFLFEKNQEVLADLPKDVLIIAVNKVLAHWNLVGDNAPKKKAINYYLVNNPFEECIKFLPKKHQYFPKCIASNRTNYTFLQSYRGLKYLYQPVPDNFYYTSVAEEVTKIDDYRNPICAAFNFAYRLSPEKIALFACDNSFEKEKIGSIKLENGLYTHAQQIDWQFTLNSMIYWSNQKEIKTVNCSSGINLNNATYISLNNLYNFLKD